MKQTLLTLASVLFCAITFAQSVPQGINYQAVARNVSGAEITNTTLTVQFSVIEQGDSSISWQEAHTVTTNDFGVFTAIIGQGTSTSIGSSATFDDIDWGSTTYSLKLEIDFGGGVFIDMGTTQFMSVPYSFYTHTAANVSATDELQSLYISGDSLCILNGNCIALMSQYLYGCTDSLSCNYQLLANTNDNSCSGIVGCIDHLAFNYNPLATCDDGSCVAVVNGCTDSLACNYDALMNIDDGSCALPNGCGDSLYLEYNDSVTCTDSSACTTLIINGCMNDLAINYNSLANLDDGSCTYPITYIPDNNFEQALINLGYDNILDDSVLTSNIDTVTSLYVGSNNIADLTGIEAFLDLQILECDNNQLTSLDVSQNTALTSLWCESNQLTSLDVSGVTALGRLYCNNNQLTSLDVSTNTALYSFNCQNNQLSTLDLRNGNNENMNTSSYHLNLSNNPNLYCIDVDDDSWSTAYWTVIGNGNSGNISYWNGFSNNCATAIYGCTDILATNYNTSATYNDGSCLDPCTNLAPWSDNFYFNQLASSWTNHGWLIHSGTSSGNTANTTGPSDDASMYGGENYIYYETSNSPQSPVSLTSECLIISGLTYPFLIFNYHMYGATVGTLDVLVNGTNVWSLSGDQGDQWNDAQVSLSAFIGTDITIEFVATYGGDNTGDIALDNISVESFLANGCTDSTANNFDASANTDDNSCVYDVLGCMNPLYVEYNPLANVDGASCSTLIVHGCMDSLASNYDIDANTDNNSCLVNMVYCLNSSSVNYNYLNNMGGSTPHYTYNAIGSSPVTVVFGAGSLESCCDDIYITDENGVQLNSNTENVTNETFTSAQINIRFDTDSSVNGTLHWTVYCAE